MDFEIKEGTDINRILKVLSSVFPKYTELEELRKELNREGVIPELEKYLVYLEDKNVKSKIFCKFPPR